MRIPTIQIYQNLSTLPERENRKQGISIYKIQQTE